MAANPNPDLDPNPPLTLPFKGNFNYSFAMSFEVLRSDKINSKGEFLDHCSTRSAEEFCGCDNYTEKKYSGKIAEALLIGEAYSFQWNAY